VERSCGLTNRNRIRGCYDRTSGLPTAKSITIKGHGGISGGRAAKAVELTPGGLRCCLEIGAERLARRIADKRLLKLIRGFLRAGVMENGLVSPVDEGTPQGGPLSPLLSNVVLDELDRELERRGHRFVRYADDCAPRWRRKESFMDT
jgi:Reverse transcriptase (RNA-dependent DNA polymerase)